MTTLSAHLARHHRSPLIAKRALLVNAELNRYSWAVVSIVLE